MEDLSGLLRDVAGVFLFLIFIKWTKWDILVFAKNLKWAVLACLYLGFRIISLLLLTGSTQ